MYWFHKLNLSVHRCSTMVLFQFPGKSAMFIMLISIGTADFLFCCNESVGNKENRPLMLRREKAKRCYIPVRRIGL
jgi:hypothetical protein